MPSCPFRSGRKTPPGRLRRRGGPAQVVQGEQAGYGRVLDARRYLHQLGRGGGGRNPAPRNPTRRALEPRRARGGSRPAQGSEAAAPPQPPGRRHQAEAESAQDREDEPSAENAVADPLQKERAEYLAFSGGSCRGLRRGAPTPGVVRSP